jgi:streptogramin lyase
MTKTFLAFALTLAVAIGFDARPSHAAVIDTVAGSGAGTDNGPTGKALETNINQPFGVVIGPDGAMYICERGLHRIRRFDQKTGEVSTYAGTGKAGFSGDGSLATEAKIAEPHELRFDKQGNLYWTDMTNHVIRRVDAKTKTISTYAGIGKQAGFGGDGGPAKEALLRSPHSLAFDKDDNLYIADIGNHRIRRVDAKTGMISTVVGNGEKLLPHDGVAAATSPILGPRALDVDGTTMWIALREGNSIWRLDLAAGTLHHVSGTGKKGFAVVDGPAKDAQYDSPKGIAVGPDKQIYIVDSSNHVIRRLDPVKLTVTVVAGVPKEAKFDGDGGSPTAAHLANPHGVGFAADGAILIGDSDNHRVRRVRP